jgi:hypothetical protein
MPTLLYAAVDQPTQSYLAQKKQLTDQQTHAPLQPQNLTPTQTQALPIYQTPAQSQIQQAQPQPQSPLHVQVPQPDLLAHTVAVAQQAEIQAQPTELTPPQPPMEQLAQQAVQQPILQAQSALHEPQQLQPEAPISEHDMSNEKLHSPLRKKAPWRQRRHRRNSAPTLSSSDSNKTSASPKQITESKKPLKWKFSKFSKLEPVQEAERPTQLPEAKKHRYFKPKREKDEDYEEDAGDEEDEDDDEEYNEVPLRTRRPKRKW